MNIIFYLKVSENDELQKHVHSSKGLKPDWPLAGDCGTVPGVGGHVWRGGNPYLPARMIRIK
jgi:hypothetical protein